jgi:hypothetical protein
MQVKWTQLNAVMAERRVKTRRDGCSRRRICSWRAAAYRQSHVTVARPHFNVCVLHVHYCILVMISKVVEGWLYGTARTPLGALQESAR